MNPIALLHRLAAPLLLCFALSGLVSGITAGGVDRAATECAGGAAPSGEQEEVNEVEACLPCYRSHTGLDSPLLDPACATSERSLPSPYGEVPVRPPEQFV